MCVVGMKEVRERLNEVQRGEEKRRGEDEDG